MPHNILDFWFSEAVKPKQFIKDPAFDQEITKRFLAPYEDAASGTLDQWQDSAQGALALTILLDQFPRNMFRDTAQMFTTDAQARVVAKDAIKRGFDRELTEEQRSFLYMPFMHSEDLQEQNESVRLYEKLGNAMNLKFAIAHKDIIERFGRFPHRNKILGRISTDPEVEFLAQPGSSF